MKIRDDLRINGFNRLKYLNILWFGKISVLVDLTTLGWASRLAIEMGHKSMKQDL